jgi:hypothetical protein
MTSEKWVPTDSTFCQAPAIPAAVGSGEAWRLPSGQTLAEFALQSGFLVPQLLAGEAVPAHGETCFCEDGPSDTKEER